MFIFKFAEFFIGGGCFSVRSRGNLEAFIEIPFERMLPDESSKVNIFRSGPRIQIFFYSLSRPLSDGAAEEIKTYVDKSCFGKNWNLSFGTPRRNV
jgi:hypothetical protein